MAAHSHGLTARRLSSVATMGFAIPMTMMTAPAMARRRRLAWSARARVRTWSAVTIGCGGSPDQSVWNSSRLCALELFVMTCSSMEPHFEQLFDAVNSGPDVRGREAGDVRDLIRFQVFEV